MILTGQMANITYVPITLALNCRMSILLETYTLFAFAGNSKSGQISPVRFSPLFVFLFSVWKTKREERSLQSCLG